MNSVENYAIRYLEPKDVKDLDQYNALLRYTFQVTEDELTATGWKDEEIKQSKFPVLERADVLVENYRPGTMEKLGVERRLLIAGENKGFLDPFSPQSDKQRQFAQSMLDQIHQQFIAVVKEGRGDRLKSTDETFSGLFWTGQQAIDLGLADHLGSLDYVAREVVKAEDVIDYTRRDNVAERLVKRFGAAMGAGAAKAATSIAAPQLR